MMRSFTSTTFLCLAALGGLSEAAFSWANITSVVSFGDSYSAIQGTAGYSNFNFIGSYEHLAFTRSTLLNDQIVQNYTSTAECGPNWLQHLTGCGVKDGLYLPSKCKIKLWDFAFSGASFSKQFLPAHNKNTIPVVNQTQQYLKYADPVLKLDKTKSLAVIWFGINDVFDTHKSYTGDLTYEQLWNQIIAASFAQSVTPLLKAGFTNFLMLNMPPMDRIPSNIGSTAPFPTSDQVDLWNSILSDQAKSFQSKNNGSKIMVYDDNTFFNKVLDSPRTYKIKNTIGYCKAISNPDVVENPGAYGCRPLSQYFWSHGVHMQSHTHQIMVNDLITFLKSQSSV